MISFFGSILAALASIIVFTYSTFATIPKVDSQDSALKDSIIEVRQDLREFRIETNKKLDILLDRR